MSLIVFGLASCSKSELEAPNESTDPTSIIEKTEFEEAEAFPENRLQPVSTPDEAGQDINDDGDDESGPRNPPKDKTEN